MEKSNILDWCLFNRLKDIWTTLSWSKLQKYVLRLQVRIAKAEKEGKRGLLTCSFAAKCLAVTRVTSNSQ